VLRSHGVLTICVTLLDGVSGQEVSGKLHVVELSSGVRAGGWSRLFCACRVGTCREVSCWGVFAAVSHGGALHADELVADPSLVS
jgi:hypothetical protein